MLKLFGTPSIEGSSGPISGRAAQGSRVALLAALALARGRPITRDKLTALLWPESPTDRARHQLSDTLYIVRGALGDDVIRSSGDELALNTDAIACDVVTFERLLDETDFAAAVELVTGPLLDGFHLSDCVEFEHWLDGERARLGQRYAAALESLAVASEERGDFSAAVAWWRKLAAQDSYTGRVALRLMRALDAAGDRAGALKHARVHAALLRDEFDAGPDAEVSALAEQLRLGPPARSASDVPRASVTAARAETPPPAISTTRPARKSTARRYVVAAGAVLVLGALGVYGLAKVRSDARPVARSLGVLPFVNMSADAENVYFSDGLSEQIITVLSRIDGLRVAARTSSFALRNGGLDARAIGDTLGVEAVLEGSVRKEGDRLRVTAQLIDAATGYHIWSGEYDRKLEDVFALQDEIAQAIADALELRLPGVRAAARLHATRNLEAYDLYLRGLYLRNALTGDALLQATRYFDRAIELEPDFALAHAAKASVIAPQIYFRHVPLQQGVREMRAVVARALELDSAIGEAHVSLGVLKLFFEWDWDGAEQAFRRAIELNPSDQHAYHMIGNYFSAMQRHEEAVAARTRAVELDPLNARTSIVLGVEYLHTGHLDNARNEFQRAQRLDPMHPLALGLGPTLPSGPVRVYLREGREREAVDELIRIATLRAATASELDSLRGAFAHSGMKGFWRRWLAMDLRQSGSNPDPLRVAVLWAMIGDGDQAFDWLDRAYSERNPGLIYLRSEPAFARLHAHPRFARVVSAMKFPTNTAATISASSSSGSH